MTRRLQHLLSGLLLLLLATGAAAAQDGSKNTEAEIAHLLGFIGTSPCQFIRNGDVYGGKDAADHVRDKYDYYRDDIHSAEDFIDRAASRSQLSGRPYQVQCPNAPTQPAGDWLRRELQLYRSSDNAAP